MCRGKASFWSLKLRCGLVSTWLSMFPFSKEGKVSVTVKGPRQQGAGATGRGTLTPPTGLCGAGDVLGQEPQRAGGRVGWVGKHCLRG